MTKIFAAFSDATTVLLVSIIPLWSADLPDGEGKVEIPAKPNAAPGSA